MVNTDTEKLIASVVNDRFPGGDIESIRIREDTDHEGDPILRIDLMVGGRARVLDPKRAISLTGDLRSRLADIGITSFPVLSFISMAEARKLRNEAA